MSSNLVKFLANLKDRKKWKKAAEDANLTDDDWDALKSGDATRIENYLASLYGKQKDKPPVNQ